MFIFSCCLTFCGGVAETRAGGFKPPRFLGCVTRSPTTNSTHIQNIAKLQSKPHPLDPTIGLARMEGIEWWRGFEQKFHECGAVTFFLARIKHSVSVLSRARVLGDFLSVIDRYPGESLLGVHFLSSLFFVFLKELYRSRDFLS